jgi:hypothetical protein
MIGPAHGGWVKVDFARDLERELSAQKARADANEKLNAELHQRISDEAAKYAAAHFKWRENVVDLEQRAALADHRLNKALDLIAVLRNALAVSRPLVAELAPSRGHMGDVIGCVDSALAATPDDCPIVPPGTPLSRYVDEMRAERDQVQRWYDELLAVVFADRPEGENERPDPRDVVRDLRTDMVRGALHWAELSFYVSHIKTKVQAFAKGVSGTTWKTHEPRVLGFKAEFDEMVSAIALPEPKLPTREQMRAIEAAQKKATP